MMLVVKFTYVIHLSDSGFLRFEISGAIAKLVNNKPARFTPISFYLVSVCFCFLKVCYYLDPFVVGVIACLYIHHSEPR